MSGTSAFLAILGGFTVGYVIGLLRDNVASSFRREMASIIGNVSLVLFAAYGVWEVIQGPMSTTLPPDSTTITIRAPEGRAGPERPFRPIPCVTTPPYSGTPCRGGTK